MISQPIKNRDVNKELIKNKQTNNNKKQQQQQHTMSKESLTAKSKACSVKLTTPARLKQLYSSTLVIGQIYYIHLSLSLSL